MNTANNIKTFDTFNPENIKYSQPKQSGQGGKNVKVIDRETNAWLVISTPPMLSFGISDYKDPNSGIGNKRFELTQIFPSEDYKTEELNIFKNKLLALETKIREDALKNSKLWFGKEYKDLNVIDALWTPMLKFSKDKVSNEYNYNKAPSFRSKVRCYDGSWKCEIFNDDGDILFPDSDNPDLEPMDILEGGKKSIVSAVLICGGLWFTNGKFTLTWELAQAVVQKPKDNMFGKKICLIPLKPKSETVDYGPMEDEDNENQPQEEAQEKENNIVKTYASDGEEDDDKLDLEPEQEEKQEEPEQEPEPAPEPKKETKTEPVEEKKKKVTKKK